MPDRRAPQHAGVAGVGVEVGQLADGAGGLGQRVAVVKVGQRHRGGAHQCPVARTPVGAPLVELLRLPARGSRRMVGGRGGGQDRAGLHADVLGGARPSAPAVDDAVEGTFGAQIGTGGGDLGDGDGHRGVVGPLTGCERSEAAADHPDGPVGGHRCVELVAGAQRVACGGGEQNARGPIPLCRRQCRRCHGVPPSIPWASCEARSYRAPTSGQALNSETISHSRSTSATDGCISNACR